jgi:hypothetical protein
MNALTGGVLADRIAREGYAFIHAREMRLFLERHGSLADWERFARSWDDLGLDTYMADGGRYRKRRFAVFAMQRGSDEITRKPHQPHYQSRDYNPLHGGVDRWFQPVLPEIGSSEVMQTVLRASRALFDRLTEVRRWHIEVHQFRIEARSGEAGKPTPEGLHRDGVDHVLVLLIYRRNVQSGETSIHDLARRKLGSFTLTEPLDAALVDDNRVFHGVTPVEPVDPAAPAYRDVLVATFRRE